MNDRPTPETDEAQFGTGRVSVDFARRLERQRDALLEAMREIANDNRTGWDSKCLAEDTLAAVKGDQP